eukprot:TRINITY_DN1645_c0_g3_i7.p3 TRINITY_DN1645_c0_g3~~TRINITY_DN1645_c0_g3_i7.p3  ORF type:complete len:129 (+),score=52.15 TRINITY_DN1645_c0_g3_i7:745-1131(+)
MGEAAMVTKNDNNWFFFFFFFFPNAKPFLFFFFFFFFSSSHFSKKEKKRKTKKKEKNKSQNPKKRHTCIKIHTKPCHYRKKRPFFAEKTTEKHGFSIEYRRIIDEKRGFFQSKNSLKAANFTAKFKEK